MKPTLHQWKMNSSIGPLYLVASSSALHGVFWEEQPCPRKKTPLLARAEKELREYLAGKRRAFTVPLESGGTAFQKRVWKELTKIPYGETISYAELARRSGSPRAARAAGSANGKNPLSLIVPCHRVIREGGALGGYAGGLARKEKLLALEGMKNI